MADTPDKSKTKKPEPRRVGQRETLVAGKKYRLRIYLGKDATTGRKIYHGETFHGSAGQAEDRIREIIRRHRANEPIKANADTFGAFLDEFIEAKRLSITESSLGAYISVVERHLRPAFGNKFLAAVMADDIQRFYNKLNGAGIKRVSLRNIHVILGMVFKLAVRRKKLNGSPMAGVELPKKGADADEAQAMTAEQVASFLEAAKGRRFENLFKLAFNVGFRPGELLALRWQDFDQDAKTLRVNHNIVFRKAGDWYLKPPKSAKGRRTLPLTDAMVAVLKSQRARQGEDRLRAGKLWQDHGFIFADTTGAPISQDVLHNDCASILKAAGITGKFSPKSGRHTMASLLIARGVSVKAVSERMGHAKVTTTLAAYAHVLPGEQEEISAEMERLLNATK